MNKSILCLVLEVFEVLPTAFDSIGKLIFQFGAVFGVVDFQMKICSVEIILLSSALGYSFGNWYVFGGLLIGLGIALKIGLKIGMKMGLKMGLEMGLKIGLKIGLKMGLEIGFRIGLGISANGSRNKNGIEMK